MKKSKEIQRQRVMNYEEFNMKAFKLAGGESAKISYLVGGIEPRKIDEDCDYHPHPDLTEKLAELQLYFVSRIGLLKGWDFSREHLRKDTKALEAAMAEHKNVVSRAKISGIKISGDTEEDRKIVITGSFKTPDGGSIGLATPQISLSGESLGYEQDLSEIAEEVKKEVYAYLFQHKKLQLDIESEIEKFEDETQHKITDESKNAEVI